MSANTDQDDRFLRALPYVLAYEGGKVDHPADKGGRTNRGIRQVTYDDWREEQGFPKRDVWEIDEVEVMTIYRDLYWWPAKGQSWPLCLVTFDCSVIAGPGRAAGWVSKVSWAKASAEAQAWAILCFRLEHHKERVKKDKSQQVFMKGWLNRLLRLAEVVHDGAREAASGTTIVPAGGQVLTGKHERPV